MDTNQTPKFLSRFLVSLGQEVSLPQTTKANVCSSKVSFHATLRFCNSITRGTDCNSDEAQLEAIENSERKIRSDYKTLKMSFHISVALYGFLLIAQIFYIVANGLNVCFFQFYF